MVHKEIYMVPQTETDEDYTNTPSHTRIIQSSDTNLDVCEFRGSKLFSFNTLDTFEFIDINDNVIFGGAIREPKSGDVNTVVGFDYGIELGETIIRKNFEDMTALEILTDIIDNFTSLTIDISSSIVDSQPIPLYASKKKKAIEIFDDMHNLLGTTHYVDSNKVLHIEYEGEELNPIVLQVGKNCRVLSDGWILDTSKLALGLIVNGDNKRIEEIETKTGDGVTSTFTLTNPYVDIKVEYPAGSGTFLSPKVTDLTSSGDYEIRKETKKIIFDSLSIPANGTDFNVYYVYNLQSNYTIPSVSTDGNAHTIVVDKEYLKEVYECRKYAEKYYNKFSKPLRSCKLAIDNIDLTKFRANQRIKVVDTFNKIDGSTIDDFFLIKELVWEFGEDGASLEIQVGDSELFVYDRFAEIMTRTRELSEIHPTAEIFNEGIKTIDFNNLQVQIETTVDFFKKADIPENVLVYDANRSYINEADYTGSNGYVYINNSDYEDLFEDV